MPVTVLHVVACSGHLAGQTDIWLDLAAKSLPIRISKVRLAAQGANVAFV
jgi:hypothetical protein